MSYKIEIIPIDLHFKIAEELYSERNTTPTLQPPHGLCQYVGREVFEKTLSIAIAVFNDQNIAMATMLVRNISDSALYISGHYVLSEYRGLGLSKQMKLWMRNFWPLQFDKILAYYLSSTFIKFAGSKELPVFEYPNHSWFPINASNPHEKTILGYTKF